MNRFLSLCTAALICAGSTQADPLCDAFASAEAMPKKYSNLAPVLSGSSSDWIITADQMDAEYAPGAEAAELLAQIVAEFAARGTQLAIVMPPPRPLIAGQATVDALSGGQADFDAAAVAASFDQMIEVVRDAGAIAPNLLELATRDDAMRSAFYYRHDTHWTPQGAAHSALALAEEVIAAGLPGFAASSVVQPEWETQDILSERGSLADMAKAVCEASIAPVELPVPAFADAGLSLLDDTSDRPRILLAGSSFSNRYKKDAYRVADAIAGTLQAEVINHSVSGGGSIGAIEGIVNAGLLGEHGSVDLVVWELPYTEGLRSLSPLRQLLGALQMGAAKGALQVTDLEPSGETKMAFEAEPNLLALNLPNVTAQRIKVDLRFENGSKKTMTLLRKSHVPAALQSAWWALSLDAMQGRVLTSAKIRYDGATIGDNPTVYLF